MLGTREQPNYHSVRVYYPSDDVGDKVHAMAYEDKHCVGNGCPRCGPNIKPNQGYEFVSGRAARDFLRRVRQLSDVVAAIAKGELLKVSV